MKTLLVVLLLSFCAIISKVQGYELGKSRNEVRRSYKENFITLRKSGTISNIDYDTYYGWVDKEELDTMVIISYYKRNKCIKVRHAMKLSGLNNMIIELNYAYKRISKTSWMDGKLKFKILLKKEKNSYELDYVKINSN